MKVTVLRGGPGDQREVSLIGGKAVADALRACGHDVFEADISPENLAALDRPADVVFPALHGFFGEDGQLQEILEKRHISFVGSGARASRRGMNKVEAKRMWEKAGLPTAEFVLIKKETYKPERALRIAPPCVVKHPASGSGVDVHVCEDEPAARDAIAKVLARVGQAMVEKYIVGAEVTVGILEERALPPIRVTTTGAFCGFEAMSRRADTQYSFDLDLPTDVIRRAQELAIHAHQVLGCRDMSRVDMIIGESHHPCLLEINTIPGFTDKSLLPKAAARAGIGFKDLVNRLVRRAARRPSGSERSAAELAYC